MLRLQVNTSYFLLSPCLYCHDNFQCVYFFVSCFFTYIVHRCNHHYWKRYFECIQFGDHEQNNDTDIETNDCIPLSIRFFFHVVVGVVVIFESCDMIHNVLRFMTIRKEPFTVYPYQSHQRFRLEYQMMLSALFSCVCISFVII